MGKGKDKALGSIYYNLGLNAEAKGDLPQALEFYQKAQEDRARKPPKSVKKAIERISGDIALWTPTTSAPQNSPPPRQAVWAGDYQPRQEAFERGEWQAAIDLWQTVHARSQHHAAVQQNIQVAQTKIAQAKAQAEAEAARRRQEEADAAALQKQQRQEAAQKERDRQQRLNAAAFAEGKRAFERGSTHRALTALKKVEENTPHFTAAQSMLEQSRQRAQTARDQLSGLNLNYSAAADFFGLVQQGDLANLKLFAAAGTNLNQSDDSGYTAV